MSKKKVFLLVSVLSFLFSIPSYAEIDNITGCYNPDKKYYSNIPPEVHMELFDIGEKCFDDFMEEGEISENEKTRQLTLQSIIEQLYSKEENITKERKLELERNYKVLFKKKRKKEQENDCGVAIVEKDYKT